VRFVIDKFCACIALGVQTIQFVFNEFYFAKKFHVKFLPLKYATQLLALGQFIPAQLLAKPCSFPALMIPNYMVMKGPSD
jgi:hypothetical protein